MSKENIYKQAKKNYDKKFNFAHKFNTDNNLEYGDEGFMDWDKVSSELEQESNVLAMELTNMVAYTIHEDVEGIESEQISSSTYLIQNYTNRKERAEFMISVLQKQLKRIKSLEFLTED